MTDTTSDILDLIDAAIDDDTMGLDAVRYNAPAVRNPNWSRLFFTNGAGLPAARSEWVEIPASRIEWTDAPRFVLTERMRALAESFDQATANLRQFSGTLTAQLSQLQVERLKRLFMRPPCRFGWDCLCHPAPFPAARDYRRRTKHRNRRRQ